MKAALYTRTGPGAGVSPGRVGERVWLWLAAAGRRWGPPPREPAAQLTFGRDHRRAHARAHQVLERLAGIAVGPGRARQQAIRGPGEQPAIEQERLGLVQ
jgi:hypothetical protein